MVSKRYCQLVFCIQISKKNCIFSLFFKKYVYFSRNLINFAELKSMHVNLFNGSWKAL